MEECLVVGFTNSPSSPICLEPEEATTLLKQVEPTADRLWGIKQIEIQESIKKAENKGKKRLLLNY